MRGVADYSNFNSNIQQHLSSIQIYVLNITYNITQINPVAQLIGDEGRYGLNPRLF